MRTTHTTRDDALPPPELLILGYVVDVWVPFQWLVDKQAIGDILNERFHYLDISATASLLERLFQEEYIIARQEHDGGYFYFTPNRRDIDEGLQYPSLQGSLYDYGLRPKGGAYWEMNTKPDWNTYVFNSYGTSYPDRDNPCPQEGEIITTSKRFTQQCLATVKRDQVPITGILPETELWDVLNPWQATYWKELSVGHRVRFLYTDESSAKDRNT